MCNLNIVFCMVGITHVVDIYQKDWNYITLKKCMVKSEAFLLLKANIIFKALKHSKYCNKCKVDYRSNIS